MVNFLKSIRKTILQILEQKMWMYKPSLNMKKKLITVWRSWENTLRCNEFLVGCWILWESIFQLHFFLSSVLNNTYVCTNNIIFIEAFSYPLINWTRIWILSSMNKIDHFVCTTKYYYTVDINSISVLTVRSLPKLNNGQEIIK